MIKENLLSISDIARELNTGKATIKFLLKRFKKYFPSQRTDGRYLYPADTLKTLLIIQEKLEMGVLPSDIEQSLEVEDSPLTDALSASFEAPLENGDIRMSNDGLALLKSLFNDIGKQQKRIATAHEKRAQAEERKAVAIEKRASAEEKKAEAMNNIAAALQEMNQLRTGDPSAQQIAHQAAKAITNDELPEPLEVSPLDELNESDDLDALNNFDELNGLEDSVDLSEMDDIDEMNSDLSSLLEEDEILEQTSDDLMPDDSMAESSDVEFDSELEKALSDPLADLEDVFEDDLLEGGDLSSLINEDSLTEDLDITHELDDLSALIDDSIADNSRPDDSLPDESQTDESIGADSLDPDSDMPLDDLSKLIDPQDIKAHEVNDDLDDLSLLIDAPGQKNTADQKTGAPEDEMPLDDLSALIDQADAADQTEPQIELDDLSKLIDPQKNETESLTDEPAGDLDDLSLLIDSPDTPKDISEIKIDVTPEDGLDKYKAAVMKVIIALKAEGLNAEETTDQLNKNQIQTLSGKSKWGQKAISQIYKFIDAAK